MRLWPKDLAVQTPRDGKLIRGPRAVPREHPCVSGQETWSFTNLEDEARSPLLKDLVRNRSIQTPRARSNWALTLKASSVETGSVQAHAARRHGRSNEASTWSKDGGWGAFKCLESKLSGSGAPRVSKSKCTSLKDCGQEAFKPHVTTEPWHGTIQGVWIWGAFEHPEAKGLGSVPD
ncbi:uncharacterized protein BKA78DRAFT_370622 [Phyllosticta capitalensis]|uniref:uncharacterized protein n=1 Tax=Phyllosticta capitalensis TaxID=121624 RepID=UPI00312D90A5